MNWQLCALAAAFFGGVTAILAKIGISGVDSNLATAIRTVVIGLFAWSIVFAQGSFRTVPQLTHRTWIFLVLSGLATGLSWLFYFRALQMAPASRVAPIDKLSLVFTVVLAAMFLGEAITPRVALGAAFMAVGTLLLIR
ncbi:MAG TPA: EamA family transporter [Abditibacteriaceae bacterium]